MKSEHMQLSGQVTNAAWQQVMNLLHEDRITKVKDLPKVLNTHPVNIYDAVRAADKKGWIIMSYVPEEIEVRRMGKIVKRVSSVMAVRLATAAEMARYNENKLQAEIRQRVPKIKARIEQPKPTPETPPTDKRLDPSWVKMSPERDLNLYEKVNRGLAVPELVQPEPVDRALPDSLMINGVEYVRADNHINKSELIKLMERLSK